jgi:hypothetical protein
MALDILVEKRQACAVANRFIFERLRHVAVNSVRALQGTHYPSPERMAELSGALLKIAFAAISPAWFLGVGCLGRLVGVR